MTGPTLWYAGQATGIVCLVLFTAVTVLGVLVADKVRLPGLPRFGTIGLHRTVSMMAMVFLLLHILTAVVDSYVDISPLAAVVPFTSSYQPLWIGLGTVSLDLMLAIGVTSMFRARIGLRTWRAVHLLAYVSWPVAVLHGYELGAGRGSPMTGWTLWLTIGCVLAVAGAVGARLVHRAGRITPELVMSTSMRSAGKEVR